MKIISSWLYHICSILLTAGSLLMLGLFLFGKASFGQDLALTPMVSLILNLVLILLFGLQHSIMARAWFKNSLQKFIPAYLERSTFNLVSSITLILILLFWQDIEGLIWHVENSYNKVIVYFFFGVGLGFAGLGVFSIRGADLLGNRQLQAGIKNISLPQVEFQIPFIYRVVRHPIYFGFLLLIWSYTFMNYSHFIFALGMTAYIFIGVHYEEKSLVKLYGDRYLAYQSRVPQIIPAMKF